jgi:hypothetical protein
MLHRGVSAFVKDGDWVKGPFGDTSHLLIGGPLLVNTSRSLHLSNTAVLVPHRRDQSASFKQGHGLGEPWKP